MSHLSRPRVPVRGRSARGPANAGLPDLDGIDSRTARAPMHRLPPRNWPASRTTPTSPRCSGPAYSDSAEPLWLYSNPMPLMYAPMAWPRKTSPRRPSFSPSHLAPRATASVSDTTFSSRGCRAAATSPQTPDRVISAGRSPAQIRRTGVVPAPFSPDPAKLAGCHAPQQPKPPIRPPVGATFLHRQGPRTAGAFASLQGT